MTIEQIKGIFQMLITLIVTIASILGFSMSEELAQQVAIVITAVGVIAYSVWRSCNLTRAAGYGEEVTRGIKKGTIDTSAVEAFLGVANDGVHVDGKEPQDDSE